MVFFAPVTMVTPDMTSTHDLLHTVFFSYLNVNFTVYIYASWLAVFAFIFLYIFYVFLCNNKQGQISYMWKLGNKPYSDQHCEIQSEPTQWTATFNDAAVSDWNTQVEVSNKHKGPAPPPLASGLSWKSGKHGNRTEGGADCHQDSTSVPESQSGWCVEWEHRQMKCYI